MGGGSRVPLMTGAGGDDGNSGCIDAILVDGIPSGVKGARRKDNQSLDV